MKKALRFLAALAVMTAVVAVGYVYILQPAGRPATGGHLRVVAGANFWGDIARQIGGTQVSVTSLMSDAAADPHLYEANAAGSRAVAEADLVIINGLGYDDFLDKALQATPRAGRQLIRAAEASSTPAGANPHIWYDPIKTLAVAESIRAGLTAADPAHAAQYQSNFEAFKTGMQPVMAAAQRIMVSRPGAAVAYTERVPEYLLATAGLQILTPPGFAQASEDGSDASPADTAAMQALIKQHKIQVLIYNPQATSPVTDQIKQLAQVSNVPVVPMTETLPANEPSFQAWQLHQINALGDALNVR